MPADSEEDCFYAGSCRIDLALKTRIHLECCRHYSADSCPFRVSATNQGKVAVAGKTGRRPPRQGRHPVCSQPRQPERTRQQPPGTKCPHSHMAAPTRSATGTGRASFKAGAAGFLRTKGRTQYRFSLHRTFPTAISTRNAIPPPPQAAFAAPEPICTFRPAQPAAPIGAGPQLLRRRRPGRSWRSRIPTLES